jgi:predicted Zn-dependent protease
VLKASHELCELRIAKLGDEHYYTIDAGKNYAEILQKANRREEARELLMKLLEQQASKYSGLITILPRVLNQCSNAQRANTQLSM